MHILRQLKSQKNWVLKIFIYGGDYDLQGSICIGINSIDRLSKSDLNKIDVIELKYLDSYFTDEIFSTGDWIYQIKIQRYIT